MIRRVLHAKLWFIAVEIALVAVIGISLVGAFAAPAGVRTGPGSHAPAATAPPYPTHTAPRVRVAGPSPSPSGHPDLRTDPAFLTNLIEHIRGDQSSLYLREQSLLRAVTSAIENYLSQRVLPQLKPA